VSDPVTDVDAMKALFPAVRSAAQILGLDTTFQSQLTTAISEIRDWPRTDAATHTQVLTASAHAGGQDVMALSANPTATSHNSENLDLEATYPYGLIGDNAGTLTDLEKRTYTNPVYRNDADWDYDSLYAARLGLPSEVGADLIATTEKYQLLPSGMASLFAQANSNEPYDEESGIVAATLDEAPLSVTASTDGTNFTTVAGSTGRTFDPATTNTVAITVTPTSQRYWRITITANTGWPAGQLSEFQVWNQ
jgi:hypothetical protein